MILNLAVWFALHTWFRKARPFRALALSFDVSVPASIDPWALALSAAAVVAIFRFKAGMIPILLACAGAGTVMHFVGAV